MRVLERPLHLALLFGLGWLVAVNARADKHPIGEWYLSKNKRGYKVFNLYASKESRVPQVRIEGVINVPYDDAVDLLWDPEYQSTKYLNAYIEKIQQIKPGKLEREDFYVFRVPIIARMAVRIGSGLRGSVGRRQYGNLRLTLERGADEAWIRWKDVPIPANIERPQHAYAIRKNEGHWRLEPLTSTRTRFAYWVDACPGGRKVPLRLIRWANNAGTRLPRILEQRYRDRQRSRPDP
tara:strand:- start:222 stop:932 length:711 start_codon:yes stop_codon:yes gene_type:complete